MKAPSPLKELRIPIAAVERDSGLSKDTLRIWERRYGFPAPSRDALGERVYTVQDVDKLRLIKRLLDTGHRPGRLVGMSFEALCSMFNAADSPAPSQPAAASAVRAPTPAQLMPLVKGEDVTALREELSRWLAHLGVARFVLEVLAPMSVAVGDAWVRGRLEVFEEHAYTEAVQVVLRQALAGIPVQRGHRGPRVLLTTLPLEPHGLGLLMAEAMLLLEGCHCASLGVQTPLWDIVLAASAYRADIVALSFTGCMNPNQVVDALVQLRAKLPARVGLWAGGTAPVLQRRRVEGVLPMITLEGIPAEVQRWRTAPAGAAA